MSIIVQMEGSDEIKMYMKGADSEIKKRLTADVNFKHLTATTRYTDFYKQIHVKSFVVFGVRNVELIFLFAVMNKVNNIFFYFIL